MRELKLAINYSGWRAFSKRRVDPVFSPIARKVHERDAYTCYYCDFQAEEYQEVINVDANYANNVLSNLATCCCFCSQCLFLQSAGTSDVGGGQLIYLPELGQHELNALCHVLFCATNSSTSYADESQAIYRGFKFRSQLVENAFGPGASDPHSLGQAMIEYKARFPKEKIPAILEHLRLLPLQNKFTAQLLAWSQSALDEIETTSEAS